MGAASGIRSGDGQSQGLLGLFDHLGLGIEDFASLVQVGVGSADLEFDSSGDVIDIDVGLGPTGLGGVDLAFGEAGVPEVPGELGTHVPAIEG